MLGFEQIAALSPEGVRPLRRAEYDRLVELGVFEDERVELLGGVLVPMSPQKPPHAAPIERLTHLLVTVLTGRARVRVQLPLAIADDSEPEPDVAVVAPGDYDHQHPTTALLVIEVADSSLAIDRQLKASLYAAAGIPEYWVVNLRDAVIEVHTEPVRDAYSRVSPVRPGESIRLVSFPEVEIAVGDVLKG